MRYRSDWRDREDVRREPARDRPREDDFGQADFNTDYGYDPKYRRGYRVDPDPRDVRDYGQADYTQAYGYDPVLRTGYRRDDYAHAREAGPLDDDRGEEPRSWRDRAGSMFGRETPRRRGPSDHVIWVAVTEALERARGLDASDIEVLVENGEVTLNGTVRRREDKRRAEDLADTRDVANVQNNLRARHHWGFG